MKQVQVPFNNTTLTAFQDETGQVWIAVKPIAEKIGVDYRTQQKRIQADPKFNCRHMPSVGADGKDREMLCLRLEHLPLWMCSINANKVKCEIADQLLEFQMRCHIVLHDYFSGQATAQALRELEARFVQLVTQLTQQLAQERAARHSAEEHTARLEQRLNDLMGFNTSQERRGLKQRHLKVLH